jgi:hypothetical protein
VRERAKKEELSSLDGWGWEFHFALERRKLLDVRVKKQLRGGCLHNEFFLNASRHAQVLLFGAG